MRIIISCMLAAWLWLCGTPALAGCTVGQIAALPVTMQGLGPMVDSKINGMLVRFMADSGAFYSVITPGTAAAFGLHLDPLPPFIYMRGINCTVAISVAARSAARACWARTSSGSPTSNMICRTA